MRFGEQYTVVRFYQNDRRPRIIKRGLTLEEAQKHCNDPETSSKTARAPRGCMNAKGQINMAKWQRWNDLQKHWFDGYERSI